MLSRRAISIDPNFAASYGVALACYTQRKDQGWLREDDVAEGTQFALRAVEVGGDDAFALSRAANFFALVTLKTETADTIVDQAIAINPNLAEAWRIRGFVSTFLGKHELALEQFQYAMRLNPLDPQIHFAEHGLALANFLLDRLAIPLSWATKSIARQNNYASHIRLAMTSSAMLGRTGDAQVMRARLRELGADVTTFEKSL